MLLQILSSVKYLDRHGLALRGGVDAESNSVQLLRLRAEELAKWLDRNTKKYTPHENQNEMLEIMALHILQKIIHKVHALPFCAFMVDDTTDVSNKDNCTIQLSNSQANQCVYYIIIGASLSGLHIDKTNIRNLHIIIFMVDLSPACRYILLYIVCNIIFRHKPKGRTKETCVCHV